MTEHVEAKDKLPRRRGSTDSLPDIMNDPAFDTNTDAKGKGVDEPDTCRICRGEGSEDDPLFYPCKCSGSIKFVHQPCLMEWLSHSQKKHCELCKTPFQFTKLYDPNMPEELPTPIFAKELAIHAVRTLITWLRFLLVAFVWLGWLPWSMRAVWRALFWLADGRWPSADLTPQPAPALNHSDLWPSGANGSSVVNSSVTSEQPTISAVPSSLPQILSPMSSMLNLSSGSDVFVDLAKRIFASMFTAVISGGNLTDANRTTTIRQRQPSWLSDVAFLNSLTSSPTLNNIVIDILEGQLITLLVVVSFILVFLIREWVVQQQPAVDMAEEDRNAMAQLMVGNQDRAERQEPPARAERPAVVIRPLNVDGPAPAQAQGGAGSARDANPRENPPGGNGASNPEVIRLDARPIVVMHARPGSSNSPPTVESRNLQDGTSANNRIGEETSNRPATNQQWPGLDTFKELWSRGNGNPDEILRIIEEEGLQDELGWIVSAMTRLKQVNMALVESQGNAGAGPSGLRRPADGGSEGQGDPGLVAAQLTADRIRAATGGDPTVTVRILPRGAAGRPPAASADHDAGEGPSGLGRHAQRQSDNTTQSGDQSDWETVATQSDVGHQNDPTPQANHDDHNDHSSHGGHDNDSDHGDRSDHDDHEANNIGANNADAAPVPQGFFDRVIDWLWGDAARLQARLNQNNRTGEDRVPHAPLAPAGNRQPNADERQGENQGRDPGPAADANDIDAAEDGDDFEGILELIGMQGPIFGLLQNGVFSALLISFTVAIGIWLPYLWGKIVLVFLTNPVQLFLGVPLAVISITADILVDTLIGTAGYVFYLASILLKVALRPLGGAVPLPNWVPANFSFNRASLSLIDGSSRRLRRVLKGVFTFHESELPVFSVLAHQALRMHEERLLEFLRWVVHLGETVYREYTAIKTQGRPTFSISVADIWAFVSGLLSKVQAMDWSSLYSFNPFNWLKGEIVVNISGQVPADQDLVRWDTKDRLIAILIGYMFASLLGIMYLKISAFFSGVRPGQRVDGLVADVLLQAGGVMKVILIIGIEMLVFPLYCGILLDLALLPLFENATVASRIEFTKSAPLTSVFVHWFIGTCYMFHFALFVSMCRKIMRTGVLYFIRDPDDPTFHPVRDVLERNILTQLRKIAFSALVYGALVIVCLGGVVWGLDYAVDGVLPIHVSSEIPVLEFPVDLLFYTFVMPYAIRALKPSEAFQQAYSWWFRRCARFLRLSHFLFGERRRDEEGHHVRPTWRDVLQGKKGDPNRPVITEEDRKRALEKGDGVYFQRDGKFVRAPASDQVRIPKGAKVFLEVTEHNRRVDGLPDSDDGLHGRKNSMFTKVYIPPHFGLRIAVFIFSIWVSAAVTGLSVTIVPLLAGRKMLSWVFPPSVQINDLYALSAGLLTFGSIIYALVSIYSWIVSLRERAQSLLMPPRQAVSKMSEGALQFLHLVYVSTAFIVVIPFLFALLTELYVLIPLHTYFHMSETHVVHLVQDWTLGVLYVQVALRLVQLQPHSRPALALNAIIHDGWLRPNARLATRAFILPAIILSAAAVALPLVIGFLANILVFRDASDVVYAQVYRYAYPATMLAGVLALLIYLLRKQIGVWKAHIRDDVYLVGERLHNFGEKHARDVTPMPPRVTT